MKKVSLIKSRKFVTYAKKNLVPMMTIKSIPKKEIIVVRQENLEFRGAAHNICKLRYKTPNEIPAVFENGSTCDYHSIINQLPKEFNVQLECSVENTENYTIFSVPIKKELENNETITYKLKFIDILRYMLTSLPSLVDNLSEIHKKESKVCQERRKIKSVCNYWT